VKAAAGQRVIDFLLSAEGQKVIGDFRVEGQQLFHPNAGGTGQ
jgi:tungstate transport system substrate-binding protein